MIMENETISEDNKNSEFKKWAMNYNVTTQYSQYDSEQNATKVQMQKNVTEMISELFFVNSQITKILGNGSLSIEEQREAIEELEEQQYSKEISTLLFIRRLFDPQDVISNKRSIV